MNEDLTLAALHDAMLEFLRGRTDAVVFGAQAVNAYVDEPRMTQDIGLQSVRAADLAKDLRSYLADRFHVAIRIRQVGTSGYRIFQLRQPKNRHLADLRQVDDLPASRAIAGVLVMEPSDLIAEKVIAYERRKGQPKAGTDWRDLASLLLAFPELKTSAGAVRAALDARRADGAMLASWESLVSQEIVPEDDEY